MGLTRVAISNPAANTNTKVFTAGEPYLLSLIATNLSASASSNIRVWVQPSGATQASQYAYIIYDIPVEPNNSYETFRFAINPLDDVYIRSSTASVSFQANGLVQYDVKLGAGVSSYSANAPANPVAGMVWVDSDGTGVGGQKPAYIYDGTTWQQIVGGVDVSANYTWTGANTFNGVTSLSASTSIGPVSSTEISYLDGTTSSIQNQINNLQTQVNSIEAIAMLGL